MRITVALDRDVALLLAAASKRQRRTKKDVINSALRYALKAGALSDGAATPPNPTAQIPPTPALPLDQPDHQVLAVALERYFGLTADRPPLYLVGGQR